MFNYVIVKIGAVTEAQRREFETRMGMEVIKAGKVSGKFRVGPEFQGTVTIQATSSAYILGVVCQALRSAAVPYSLHEGRKVGKRVKPCGTSTQSCLNLVATMSEVQSGRPFDLESTTPESAEQPPETNGNTNSS